MIDYAWVDTLDDADGEQLRDLLERAAVYDAEPEYNTVDYAEVRSEMADADSASQHLMLWLQPRARELGGSLEPRRVAGVIRCLPTADGWSSATVVIDPELRSIGIMTLLMERAGLRMDGPEGWLGSGITRLQSWARGNHPASGRLADRNLVARDRQIWKLIRETTATADLESVLEARGEDASGAGEFLDLLAEESTADPEALRRAHRDLADQPLGGTSLTLVHRIDGRIDGLISVDPHPVLSEEFGKCASVRYLLTPAGARATMDELLTGAAAAARQAGLDGLILYVDSTDNDLVGVCRLSGFQHDRTDIRYEIH